MAASTPPEQPPAPAAAAPSKARPTRKKKPKAALIAGLAFGAVAVAALIYFWPELMKKVSHGNQELAAEQAATNAPPPPPPELTTEEILQKVGDTYKGLTDYAAKAQTIAEIDMSALVPGKKGMRMNTMSTMQLGRTNFYRLEWDQNADGKNVKGAAWNSGKGNFIGYGAIPPSKVKTRELALAPAAASFLLSGGIAELFFSDTNSFAELAKDFTKTNGSSPTGQPCYMLTGEVNHEGAFIWIDKSSFMIVQLEGILGGTIDDAELKKLPSGQRAQAMALAKLKGSVIETYTSIQTNQSLAASSFETAFKPAGNVAAARGKRAAPTPGSMAQPRRSRGPPPQ